jgi:hypothetical protein
MAYCLHRLTNFYLFFRYVLVLKMKGCGYIYNFPLWRLMVITIDYWCTYLPHFFCFVYFILYFGEALVCGFHLIWFPNYNKADRM